MKRVIVVVFMAIIGLVAMPESANAQINLSKVGKLFGNVASKPQRSPYQELAESAPAKNQITGTWNYDTFRVEYLGSNAFAQGAIAQLENFATQEIKNAGIGDECYTIVLRGNGKGVFQYDDLTYEGNYTYDASTAQFQFTAKKSNGTQIVCNGFIKMDDGRLVTMLKAEDVVRAIAVIAPEVQTDDTYLMVKGVVDSFSGIYISLYHKK